MELQTDNSNVSTIFCAISKQIKLKKLNCQIAAKWKSFLRAC